MVIAIICWTLSAAVLTGMFLVRDLMKADLALLLNRASLEIRREKRGLSALFGNSDVDRMDESILRKIVHRIPTSPEVDRSKRRVELVWRIEAAAPSLALALAALGGMAIWPY